MNLQWQFLTTEAQLDLITTQSFEKPCLLFKHSTRCEISAIAQYRLEDDWSFQPSEIEPWYLDLIQHRPISNAIAERFAIPHESPQVLLIRNGVCIYDASHLDISVDEIRDASVQSAL